MPIRDFRQRDDLLTSLAEKPEGNPLNTRYLCVELGEGLLSGRIEAPQDGLSSIATADASSSEAWASHSVEERGNPGGHTHVEWLHYLQFAHRNAGDSK